jgi:hypothetical protein
LDRWNINASKQDVGEACAYEQGRKIQGIGQMANGAGEFGPEK